MSIFSCFHIWIWMRILPFCSPGGNPTRFPCQLALFFKLKRLFLTHCQSSCRQSFVFSLIRIRNVPPLLKDKNSKIRVGFVPHRGGLSLLLCFQNIVVLIVLYNYGWDFYFLKGFFTGNRTTFYGQCHHRLEFFNGDHYLCTGHRGRNSWIIYTRIPRWNFIWCQLIQTIFKQVTM